MSNPRPESRIKSLENRASSLEATIEELSSDTAEEFKAIRQDIKLLGEHVDEGFKQAHAYIQENIATKNDIIRLENKMTAMEGRLVDTIKQLWAQRPKE